MRTPIVFGVTLLAVLFAYQNCADTSFKKRQNPQTIASANGIISVSLADVSVNQGDPVLLVPSISTDLTNLSYQWYFNDQPIPNAMGSSYSIASAELGDSGFYKLSISSQDELAEVSAFLTVIPVVSTKPCDLPWGGTIEHGQSVPAFPSATVACNQQCQSETRTCNDGTLSGSATAQSCKQSGSLAPRRLVINLGDPRDQYTGTYNSGTVNYNLANLVCGDWKAVNIRMAAYNTRYTTCGGVTPLGMTVGQRVFTIYRGSAMSTSRVARYAGCWERKQTDFFSYNGGTIISVRNQSTCPGGKCGSIHGGGPTQIYVETVGY